jgi:hypothetical protein
MGIKENSTTSTPTPKRIRSPPLSELSHILRRLVAQLSQPCLFTSSQTMRWVSTVRPPRLSTPSARRITQLFLFRTFLAARKASPDYYQQKCTTSRVQSQDYSAQGERDDGPEKNVITYKYHSCIVCDRILAG